MKQLIACQLCRKPTFVLFHININWCCISDDISTAIFAIQDADAAYMTKVDLETQVNALSDELDFLRQIYDAVINLFDLYLLIHLAECCPKIYLRLVSF